MKTIEQVSKEFSELVNGYLDANRPFTQESAAVMASVLLGAATDFAQKTMGAEKTFHALITTAASVKGVPAPTAVQIVAMPIGGKSGKPH